MSETQSLAAQLGWCITTQDYLNGLNSEIRYVSGQYASMVTMLQQHNYIAELLPQIQQMQREFEDSANDLIKHVESEHLSYIESQSKDLQGMLTSLPSA
jgi:DNA-binding FrmR family transcriptional regulator